MTFTTIPSLARALDERNYAEPTPVQSAVLAPEALERDLLVSAQTGSGKTVAYGLSMAPTLLGAAETFGPATKPQALVIAPTRELALQVARELGWLYQYARTRIATCVGGMDARRERRNLEDGAHIVVGTPGRLRDHMERGALDLSELKAVVLDEADEMLDLGFREDLEFILKAAPATKRSLLFSATMPKAIATLAKDYQRNAQRIEVTGGKSGHADIEYRAIRVAPHEHEHVVVNLLRMLEAPTAMVFCNTREAVRHLHAILQERGFSAVVLSGELSQHERNQAMLALRSNRARVCVATDVAARGIDLPNVGIVIHAELPHDVETMQHRSGRTGRAGRKGVSAVLVPMSRRRRAERLFVDAKLQPLWGAPPSAEEIRAKDQERLLDDPVLNEANSEEDLALARLLLAQKSPEEVAAALARLYRAQLPAYEDVTDPGYAQSTRERPARDRDAGPAGVGKKGFGGDSTWFRLDIGRTRNADPKWLLPMLCKRGQITRQDIGSIKIFDHETLFEIATPAAERFLANSRRPSPDNIRIHPADAARTHDKPPKREKYKGGKKDLPEGKVKKKKGKYPKGV
ncbi:DEAD/DEAH box helicase [Methylovirgula sp. 4M-Z18]|uniref:DEAD/DEAH box helicase n=1 Tax=Methylovirgula sp. 4M-Z18 TaxID=2293567 RepID=UPI000E2EC202|nr:DEAD/DEAH box helicase [Methylovirgula sp. 4M-Z18]RFB79416.1 DEAD/DEAH box helicase [Methylovirgula sp. 4M-Z18]